MSGHLKYDVTTGHLLYEPDGHLVYQCVFTAANADLVVGPATLSATATFTVPVYTATSELTAGAATLQALAETVVENYVAVALLETAPATLSASATHVEPTYTATSALTVGAAVLSAEATHVDFQDCVIDIGASLNAVRGINMLVWTTPSIGYAFFIDHDNTFSYRKTTDGGSSFAAPVLIGSANVLATSVWYDRWTPGDSGTTVHLWYADQSTDIVYYRPFDTATDSLGTERTVYTGSAFNSVAGNFVSGAKMRGGNLLCCFGQGAAELGTYRSTDGGATWSARTNLVEAFGDVAKVFPGGAADNQDAWILYQDASADELSRKVHDDSANTNSEASIMSLTEGAANTGEYGFAGAIRHSDNELIAVGISENDTSTSDFRVFEAGSAITELTALATNKSDIYYPSVYIDSSAQIFVAYIGKRDGTENLGTKARVYYSRSSDGGSTWGDDEIVSADLSAWRQTWCAPSGPNFTVAWREGNFPLRLLMNCEGGIFTHTATAALTAPAAILSAVGVGDTDYTATAALTAPAAVLVAVAQHAGEVFHTATAALTTGAATLAATATFDTTVHTATSALTTAAAILEANAFFTEQEPDVFTATAALEAGPATLSASATSTEPTYTATSALTAPAAILTAASTAADANIGTAALEAGPATLTATATHTERTYTATSALAAPAATLSASATFTEPLSESIGHAALTAGAATLSATATHLPKTYTATATLTAPAATLSAAGVHTEPPPNGPCEQCELNTTPPTVTVRLGGTVGAGTCSAVGCMDVLGDYIVSQGGKPPTQGAACVYYETFEHECGTFEVQVAFLTDLVEIVVGYVVNGSPTGTVVYQKALTSPYHCTTDILGSYTLFNDGSTTCDFTNVTLEVVEEACGHCSGTQPTAFELTLSGVTNDTCATCDTELNQAYILSLVGGDFPCTYQGEASSNCGAILITAELLETGILGKFQLDSGGGYETMFTFTVSLTAPYSCTVSRTPTAANKLTTPCNFNNVSLTWNMS